MLVLARKMGQSIEIPNEGITIQVLAVRGNRVQIGITAPNSTRIIRQEILEAGSSPEMAGVQRSVQVA
jgi:carbon storage regulator